MKGQLSHTYKTGLAIRDCDGRRTSLYQSWINMRQRCNNPNHPKYKRYGARGITVCKEWNDIANFQKWALANGWEEGLTIDRIDNDGNYEPSNCRWVSLSSNSRRKSTTKITPELAEEIRSRRNEDWYKLAEEYGCTHGNIWWIMHNLTHVAEGLCSKQLKAKKALAF